MQSRNSRNNGNDHTSMTAPLPVCSAKLSMLGLGQYYGGGPRWNPQCCSLFAGTFQFHFFPLIFKNQHPGSFGVEVRVDRAIASSIVLYLASQNESSNLFLVRGRGFLAKCQVGVWEGKYFFGVGENYLRKLWDQELFLCSKNNFWAGITKVIFGAGEK